MSVQPTPDATWNKYYNWNDPTRGWNDPPTSLSGAGEHNPYRRTNSGVPGAVSAGFIVGGGVMSPDMPSPGFPGGGGHVFSQVPFPLFVLRVSQLACAVLCRQRRCP